jgi:CHAT domain-containing protein
MVEFYRRMRAGRSLAQALWEAKMEVRKVHHEPFYWASLVPIGIAW